MLKHDITFFVSVAHVRSNSGRYQIPSMTETQQECEARGMTLASRDDMLQSRALGLDVCSCGWLSDNTIGRVVRTFDPVCGFGNDNVVYTCGDVGFVSGDAYCKRQII